jgi:hypothetical protein
MLLLEGMGSYDEEGAREGCWVGETDLERYPRERNLE